MFQWLRAQFKPKTSLATALIVVTPKIAHTATACRDNFVEMRHADGYLTRYRLRVTLTHNTHFIPEVDKKPYWDYLNTVVENLLPGTLTRVCIAGCLYSIK